MAQQVLLAVALVAVTMCHSLVHSVARVSSSVPNSGTEVPAAPPNSTEEFLEAHNQARAEVGVDPFQWSEQLAHATSLLVRYQRDKHGCQFANLSNSKYGGNQLWASGSGMTPRLAVEEWVGEKKYYNHSDNSCVANHECGVYTQVVWRKSLELGCAKAVCAKEDASLTICFYNPPGNVIGESPY